MDALKKSFSRRRKEVWLRHIEVQFVMIRVVSFFAALAVIGSTFASASSATPVNIPAVLGTYADLARATYEDSLGAARRLRKSVDVFLAKPNAATLAAAKKAWIAARVPYQQSEAFRFGNKIVDAWEQKIARWPLDEGFIDYVDGDYGSEADDNPHYTANVIANKTIKIAGRTVDTSKITKELLSTTLHGAGGVQTNVATGYHVIEFLLWGQDLNGTGPGAGNRRHTDYDLQACTNGNCDRRAQYLRVVTELLVDDLQWMVDQWGAEGAARKALVTSIGKTGLIAIFTGLGSLSYGELAGERMKLDVLLADPEEELDNFADTTHLSHFHTALGIENVYLGRYRRTDGSVVSGPSVSDLVKAKSEATDSAVKRALALTRKRVTELKERGETVERYDQMIDEYNFDGKDVIDDVVEALVAQTRAFERAIAALELRKIKFKGSDALDNPRKVFDQ